MIPGDAGSNVIVAFATVCPMRTLIVPQRGTVDDIAAEEGGRSFVSGERLDPDLSATPSGGAT